MMKLELLIIGLALLASASPSYAGGIMMMGGGVGETVAACSGAYGNSGTSTASYSTYTNAVYLIKVSLDCAGENPTISAFLKYVNTTDRELRFVIYSDSGGEPNTRLWYGAATYDAASDIEKRVTQATSVSLSTGDYWIGLVKEYGSAYVYRSASTGGTGKILNVANIDSAPATWDTVNDNDSTSQYEFAITW